MRLELWQLALGGVALGAVLLPRTGLAYVNGKPVRIPLGRIGFAGVTPLYLREDAARAYSAMVAAAKNDGVQLVVSGPRSAFRSPEMQAELTKERSEFAAPVNYSPHQAGIAVDVETAQGSNAAYRWLVKYAGTYGFRNPYPDKEPWHWEYRT